MAPNPIKLTDKYPHLLEICRKYDCNFEEGIKIIEEQKRQNNLGRWVA